MKNLQIQLGVMETIILFIEKKQQRARRASYRLLETWTDLTLHMICERYICGTDVVRF